jgi:hypothetical protein
MKKIFLLASAALAFFIPDSRAQSISPGTINAAGGTKVIGGDTYDWSVAEMTLVSTVTTPSVIVTHGVLQPPDATVGIEKTIPLNGQVKVYPNPSADIVYLEYNFVTAGKLEYMLQDMTGRQIKSYTAAIKKGQDRQEINLSALANATYMLYVTYQPNGGNVQQTSFKIDKIK